MRRRSAPTSPGTHGPRVLTAVVGGIGAALVLALGAAPGGVAERAGAASPAMAAAGSVAAAAPRQPAVIDDAAPRLPALADCIPARGGAQAATDQHEAPLGALVLGMAGLMCGPLGPAAGLPATTLETGEPERLYALVTREQAVQPERYAPDDLATLPGGFYEAREEVVEQVTALLAAAREAGHEHLSVTSGFRDHDTQAGTYEDWVRRIGAERADQVSARPGHSEHQLGLAVDLTGECGGFECFGESDDGRWVAANAHRFGFIVRYPEDGKEVTGYAYEPWHLRYVGPRAAWAMHVFGERYWERFAAVALEAADGSR